MLFGGRSAEHDVSCVTARHVLEAADRSRYAVEAIGITRNGQWVRTDAAAMLAAGSTSTLPDRVEPEGEPVEPGVAIAVTGANPAATDLPVVVLPLLHGPMGEDGTVQGLLDLAEVPYVGTGVLGSAVCMDKVMAKQVASSFGIAQARWTSLHADARTAVDADALLGELGPVVFVKPANMGSSVGVSRATSPEEIAAAIETAATYDEWIVIEEGVDGREIEVGVLGNHTHEASVPGEIVPGDDFYSYDDKYHDGIAEGLIPAALTPDQTDEVRVLACRVASALRVEGLARVDFFFEDPASGGRGFLLNEVNTMPGFTPISMFPKMWQASGVSYQALIDRLVDLAIERHARRSRHRSTKH